MEAIRRSIAPIADYRLPILNRTNRELTLFHYVFSMLTSIIYSVKTFFFRLRHFIDTVFAVHLYLVHIWCYISHLCQYYVILWLSTLCGLFISFGLEANQTEDWLKRASRVKMRNIISLDSLASVLQPHNSFWNRQEKKKEENLSK